MYTWGYIREAALAKLNQTEAEALAHGFLNNFVIYANEAMTQLCSVKPKYTFYNLEVISEQEYTLLETQMLSDKRTQWELDPINIIDPGVEGTPELDVDDPSYVEPIPPTYDEEVWDGYKQILISKFRKEKYVLGDLITMPADFLAFNDDENYVIEKHWSQHQIKFVKIPRIASSNDFRYVGNNQLIFVTPGEYKISYRAYWFVFTNKTDNKEVIDAPRDVLDAIPTYIGSQCFKIDDEQKATQLRNEFEIFVGRLDDTKYARQGVIHLEGNW